MSLLRTRLGRGTIAVTGLIALTLVAAAGVSRWRGRHVGAVQRGWQVASASGCFGCHGSGGATGLEDPGAGVGGVPALSAKELTRYAKGPAELREWIADSQPRRIREELAELGLEEEPSLLQMPAFRDVLSAQQIDDLVAWLSAVAGFDTPQPPRAAAGHRAAQQLGCFGCHGPGGRGDLPNPGSLKGHVPAWDGADFPELVHDEAELREWILDGAPDRLRDHPLARRFLERQVLRMPAYRRHLSSADLDDLVAYVVWLRGGRLGSD